MSIVNSEMIEFCLVGLKQISYLYWNVKKSYYLKAEPGGGGLVPAPTFFEKK